MFEKILYILCYNVNIKLCVTASQYIFWLILNNRNNELLNILI